VRPGRGAAEGEAEHAGEVPEESGMPPTRSTRRAATRIAPPPPGPKFPATSSPPSTVRPPVSSTSTVPPGVSAAVVMPTLPRAVRFAARSTRLLGGPSSPVKLKSASERASAERAVGAGPTGASTVTSPSASKPPSVTGAAGSGEAGSSVTSPADATATALSRPLTAPNTPACTRMSPLTIETFLPLAPWKRAAALVTPAGLAVRNPNAAGAAVVSTSASAGLSRPLNRPPAGELDHVGGGHDERAGHVELWRWGRTRRRRG
jgi:hypothetical protein